MSSSNLFRWSGLATILGGVLLPTSWILRFVFGVSRPYTGTVEFIATILLVFGFMGVYGFQHEQSGVLGFLGFLLIIIHSCCALGECWLQNGELTGAAIVLAPIVGITMLLGFILLGIGSWQAPETSALGCSTVGYRRGINCSGICSSTHSGRNRWCNPGNRCCRCRSNFMDG